MSPLAGEFLGTALLVPLGEGLIASAFVDTAFVYNAIGRF
jgi:glycerol uptake facilitator-like aquaporin